MTGFNEIRSEFSMRSRNEVQLPSTVCNREEQLWRDNYVLLGQMVTIDEGLGEEDVGMLKFICRDYIGDSKLEKVSSALDIFCHLMEQALISPEDITLLIECLGLIHRYDLIRKLGFDDIDSIKSELSRFERLRISPFRKLLVEVADELDEGELSELKKLLRGRIPKNRLRETRNALELFVLMEKENLLVFKKTEPLIDMLGTIKRVDLVRKIQEYSGTGQQKFADQAEKVEDTNKAFRQSRKKEGQTVPAFPAHIDVTLCLSQQIRVVADSFF